MANRAPVLDQIEVEAIIEPGRDERGEQVVRLFDGRLFRNPAQPARDAKDVRVDGEGRRNGLKLYGSWSTSLEGWNNRPD